MQTSSVYLRPSRDLRYKGSPLRARSPGTLWVPADGWIVQLGTCSGYVVGRRLGAHADHEDQGVHSSPYYDIGYFRQSEVDVPVVPICGQFAVVRRPPIAHIPSRWMGIHPYVEWKDNVAYVEVYGGDLGGARTVVVPDQPEVWAELNRLTAQYCASIGLRGFRTARILDTFLKNTKVVPPPSGHWRTPPGPESVVDVLPALDEGAED